MLRSWRHVPLFAWLGLAGCTDSAALDLSLGGDVRTGEDLDGLTFSLSRLGAQIWSQSVTVTGDDELPLSHRVERTSRDDAVVDLSVEGTLGGRRVIALGRTVSFVTGEVVPVRICLWRRCIDADDPACAEGLCDVDFADGDADVDADAADEDDGDTDAPTDSGADADDQGVDGEADGDGMEGMLCSDSCGFARNRFCEDNGAGSISSVCDFGTDCADCSPRRAEDCVPRCDYRRCGSDGCGGSCPPGCADGEECLEPGQCMRWVEIRPEGPFWMGAPDGEVGRQADETRHEVFLNRPFLMTTTEVSRRLYAALFEEELESWLDDECGLDCPVGRFSWHGAASLCHELSLLAGLPSCYECSTMGSLRCDLHPEFETPYDCAGFRLPTEAEWEHAARAGTTTATYNGDHDGTLLGCESPNATLDSIAWFCGNAEALQPSATLEPNAFGLYDMLGGAMEWVHDWYGPYPEEPSADPAGPPAGWLRVQRGGSFASPAARLRAAERFAEQPSGGGAGAGLRLVRSLE